MHNLYRFVSFCAAVVAFSCASLEAGTTGDVFTPVIASTLSPEAHPILGTDGVYHVVYELQLTNTKLVPATMQKIEVLGSTESQVIISFSDADLLKRLRTLAPQPATDATIEPNGGRLFYIELTFKDVAKIPKLLQHRLHLTGAPNPGPAKPAPLEYVVAAIKISDAKPLIIGPPLAGAGWVAANGCCNADITHRGSVQSVNGALYDSQRFAIDWMRLDDQGRMVHGEENDVHNYNDYGADVLAVADAKVVSVLNNLDDQVPGRLPEPSSITIETVDGNHVILDLGGGRFAFYAHLQKNSIRVRPGDAVKKGAVLGKLGNTGNTSAPHLHFHIMNRPSPIAADGIPYLIDAFDLSGQIDIAAFEAAPALAGDWGKGRLAQSEPRQRQFPLNLNIINFASANAPK
ncbi:MAG TPA: M23 family metallopeptidase [Candidatus Babeliales bacterium]|nr:M23 family metallopeptidase [Candidatus Babeliales bacterium]